MIRQSKARPDVWNAIKFSEETYKFPQSLRYSKSKVIVGQIMQQQLQPHKYKPNSQISNLKIVWRDKHMKCEVSMQ